MATKSNPENNPLKEWLSTLPNKRIRTLRLVSQLTFFFLFNGVIFGLSRIQFPIPVVLPPGAPYATAWGGFSALQYILAVGQFPFLVLGVFFLTGAIFGKLTCGWACPVGFWQDLLSWLPISKIKVSRPTNRDLQDFSGFFLWGSIIVAGFFGIQRFNGQLTGGDFWTFMPFDAIIDPAGTMFVTYFYALLWGVFDTDSLLDTVGNLFLWKTFILAIFTYISIKVPRAYCRWFCPTGALLGYVSSNSILTIKRDPTKCVDGCDACEKACPTGVPITDESTDGIANNLCILCGNCVDACPDAMSFGFRF
ncbi:MAG: 4Fe-4S binding protein [Candidatus Kariarchaeaceae archaeon]|jgi:polyferredoxin